jgi:hypothetical protein
MKISAIWVLGPSSTREVSTFTALYEALIPTIAVWILYSRKIEAIRRKPFCSEQMLLDSKETKNYPANFRLCFETLICSLFCNTRSLLS